MGRVIVLGSYNRDQVLQVPRFPRAGETLHGTGMAQHHGGKGSNQAVAASRAGAPTLFTGAVGADEAGQAARALWAAEGIDAARVATAPQAPTGLALILVADGGENQIVVIAGANHAVPAAAGEAAGQAALPGDIVLAQLETPQAATLAFFRAARARGATTVLNAAPAAAWAAALLPEVDWLVVNAGEAALLAGTDAPEAAGAALSRLVGQGAIVTLGEAGAVAWLAGGALLRQPSARVRPVDTTGAGDAFVGAFAARLARAGAPEAALRDGVAAGALACTRAGAVPSLPDAPAIAALAATLPG